MLHEYIDFLNCELTPLVAVSPVVYVPGLAMCGPKVRAMCQRYLSGLGDSAFKCSVFSLGLGDGKHQGFGNIRLKCGL